MHMNYKQLTQEQRYHISALCKAGYFQTQIAAELGVHKSTISREISRNSGERGYRPKQANELALEKRHHAAKHITFTLALQKMVVEKILMDWSPDQISGYFEVNGIATISHERIYQFLLDDKKSGGTLHTHLRHSGKRRKKRYGSKDRRGQIKNRVSIDERPKVVDKKVRLGDWEGDTIIGAQQQKAIVTLVDRASRLTRIGPVATKRADIVSGIIVDLLRPMRRITHTVTLDNGKEFSGHEDIAKSLSVDIYFAHPYSSWERGLNENTNGLIRQYIKKGSSFEGITAKRIAFIEDRLNNRPRKSLGYCTPNQVYKEALMGAG
jgi:transposase, IS30 family